MQVSGVCPSITSSLATPLASAEHGNKGMRRACRKKSNPKQRSLKKVCGPKKAILKKDVKSKVVAKKWL